VFFQGLFRDAVKALPDESVGWIFMKLQDATSPLRVFPIPEGSNGIRPRPYHLRAFPGKCILMPIR
jgi:hypothetical protein